MASGMETANRYYDWIYAALRPFLGKSVLEIGPGFGGIASRIITEGKEYHALDTDEGVIEHLRSTIPASRDRLHVGDIASPEWASYFKKSGIDTLLTINVLEHVADDAKFFSDAARCLESGRLITLVPAMPGLYGSLDEEAGHYRRYDPAALKCLLAQDGLTLTHLSYFNSLGALSWFLSARILRLRLNSEKTNRSVAFYDRFAIPISRRLDPFLISLGGQSLIAVVEKKK